MAAAPEIQITSTLSAFDDLFARSPTITAYHLRDQFGAMGGVARKRLLAMHAGTPMHELAKRSFFYKPIPSDRKNARGSIRAATMAAAGDLTLDKIGLRIRSFSEVARLHELGGTVSARGKLMTIPTPRGLELRRLTKKKNKPFTIQTLKDAGYETFASDDKRYIMAKRPGPDAQAEKVFRLVPFAKHRPRLGFFRMWKEMEPDRQRMFQVAMDRTVRDMAKFVREGSFRLARQRVRAA